MYFFLQQAVRESVQSSTDDSVLKCLIDLADTCPKLLRANLEAILDLMLEVTENNIIMLTYIKIYDWLFYFIFIAIY